MLSKIKGYAQWLPKIKMRTFILCRSLDSQVRGLHINYVIAMLYMPIYVIALKYFNNSTLVLPMLNKHIVLVQLNPQWLPLWQWLPMLKKTSPCSLFANVTTNTFFY